jgi:hypothetical protein
MEPEASLPCSQEPSTRPYPEPDQSSPSHPISLRYILILSPHLHLGLASGLFPSGFPTKILYAFVLHALPIPAHLILLDLIILITLDEQYKLLTASLNKVHKTKLAYSTFTIVLPSESTRYTQFSWRASLNDHTINWSSNQSQNSYTVGINGITKPSFTNENLSELLLSASF